MTKRIFRVRTMTWSAPSEPLKCTIVASVVAKTGIAIYYGMFDAWPIRSGGFSSLMEILGWQVRQETRVCHQEQLNRFRFRHRPLDCLAELEAQWEYTECM
jgi:hypothetical protein